MKVVDVFVCASSLATVVAVAVAIFALRSWRSQFWYQRKYECILDLRSQLHGANDAASYLSSLREHFSNRIRLGVGAGTFDEDRFPYPLQQAWWDHLSKLHRTWALMEVTLSKVELKNFTVDPHKIELEMRECVQEIISLGCAEPPVKLFRIHQQVSNSIISITKSYTELEKECRDVLLKIK